MTDTTATPEEAGSGAVSAPAGQSSEAEAKSALGVIYILYLVNLIAAIIGMLWINRYKDGGPDWARSHFQFLEGTFWKGLLFAVICLVLTMMFIGSLLFLVLAVWWYMRVAAGYMAFQRGEPIPNPGGWGFGIGK